MRHAPSVMVPFRHNAKDVLIYSDPMISGLLLRLAIFLSVRNAKYQNVPTDSISSGMDLLVFVINVTLRANDVSGLKLSNACNAFQVC